MFHQLLFTAFISTTCLTPVLATAAPITELPKDQWLGKLNEVVPAMMCNNFKQNETINAQLVAAKIDYKQCMVLIPASFEKCKTQFYSQIPATINKAIANTWGERLGRCIGTDFAKNHLAKS